MSILIKGMEMPTSCESCPCKTADAFGGLGCQATGYIPLRKTNQDRPDWCPIVPVPAKPPTNADRIRAMTDKELAQLLLDYECSRCDWCGLCEVEEKCKKDIMEQLKKEAGNG